MLLSVPQVPGSVEGARLSTQSAMEDNARSAALLAACFSKSRSVSFAGAAVPRAGYTVLRDAIEEDVLRQVESSIVPMRPATTRLSMPSLVPRALPRERRRHSRRKKWLVSYSVPISGSGRFPTLVVGSLVSVSLLNLHRLRPS